jgi:pimeloyl-ACP methyl ester carboxylesterase
MPHDYLLPLARLAEQRPVIFYDQLGCAYSDKTEDTMLFTVERFVSELATVRSTLCPGRLHILGQSWGSMLAIEYRATKNLPALRASSSPAPAFLHHAGMPTSGSTSAGFQKQPARPSSGMRQPGTFLRRSTRMP